MTDNSPPTDDSKANRNLDYQFYFLFRTYRWKGEELIQEPFSQFGSLGGIGVPIDTDKRLFRRADFAQIPLEQWTTHLTTAWQEVCLEYTKAFNPQHAGKQPSKPAIEFCEKMLLGVALLIMDESLERHKVIIPLVDNNNNKLSELSYQYQPTALNQQWLTIQDKPKEMVEPAQFHSFVPTRVKPAWKMNNWALRLDQAQPRLVPMQPTEGANNPIFFVCGVAHGDADTAINFKQQWPFELQAILSGRGKQNPLKKTALLNALVARLLIREVIFEWMDNIARDLRARLQQKNALYYEKKDWALKYTPTAILEEQFRDMDQLVTEANYVIGRLEQGIEALAINYDNLQWRINHLTAEEQAAWQIEFHQQQQEPSLLEHINLSIANLKSHLVYIRGKLTYLEGSRSRWRSFLTKRNYNLTQKLGFVGHLIIVLMTLAQLDKFVEPFQSQTDNLIFDGLQTVLHTLIGILQNQWVYVAILLLSVGYLIFYYVVEYLWYYIYKLRTYLRRTCR